MGVAEGDRPASRAPATRRIAPPRHWSGWAWGAMGLTGAFIAVTCWWLARDLGIPFADAASHLYTVVGYHDVLARGDFGAGQIGAGGFWTRGGYYPPLTFLVGALATFAGGLDQSAPVIGENLVYVSLMALGCYQTARLIGGPRAGFLAVLFVLGSPLLIEQFHVFMIDAPEAAMVAVSVWLILASDRFARAGVAAAAGVAVGLGLLSKEQFVLFTAGLVVVVLVREGGWRNRRGILAFAIAALAVASPWYLVNLSHLGQFASAGLANANLPARGRPPLLSIANLGWYFWAVLNGLLFAPLAAFAAIGVVRAAASLVRSARSGASRAAGRWTPELLGGLLAGWLGITVTPHHDMRYTMPLLVYLAVLGTGWIPALAPGARRLATLALALAVAATTLGATFGAGGEVRILLAGHPIVTDVSFGIPPPDQITIYADHDFNVSAPRRGDYVLALFERLKRRGFTGATWDAGEALLGSSFDAQGVSLFARFAGLKSPRLYKPPPWDLHDPRHALVTHQPLPGPGPRCLVIDDGTGVWVLAPKGRSFRLICP